MHSLPAFIARLLAVLAAAVIILACAVALLEATPPIG